MDKVIVFRVSEAHLSVCIYFRLLATPATIALHIHATPALCLKDRQLKRNEAARKTLLSFFTALYLSPPLSSSL